MFPAFPRNRAPLRQIGRKEWGRWDGQAPPGQAAGGERGRCGVRGPGSVLALQPTSVVTWGNWEDCSKMTFLSLGIVKMVISNRVAMRSKREFWKF